MKSLRTPWIIALLAVSAILAPLSSQAQLNREPDGFTMIADAVVARPAGAAVSAIGTAAFVATLPITALSKSTSSAWNALVMKPIRFTFRRPLGQFDEDI